MQPEKNEPIVPTETNYEPYQDTPTQNSEAPTSSELANDFAEPSDENDHEVVESEALREDQSEADGEQKPFSDESGVVTPLASPTKQSFFAKHKVLILICAVIVLFAAMTAGYFITAGSADEPVATKTQTQKKAAAVLGAEVTVVDGVAEVSKDGKTWVVLKVGDAVAVDQTVRTGADGRVVIDIDDGSALRVNSNSEVKVVSLESKNIRFSNQSGEVYARVVPSERVFVVAVDDETYTAKGTAYKTVNREDSQGVEVYHSAVVVGTVQTDVAEGKRYYEMNPDAAIVKKTTDIPTDQLTKDAFLAWNLEQDKKTTDYANKLGYLTTLEQKKSEAEKAAAAAAAAKTTTPTSTAGIKLTATKTDTGIKLSWTLTGVTAEKGFKIVKSKTANPTFGVNDATYVSASTTRSYTWTLKDGKTYNFRVCTYTGDSCTNYSNNASATAPLYTSWYPTPSGSVSLSSAGGKNVEWTLNGSAPNGYKLVWGTSENPVYPGSSAAYYDKSATNGAVETTGTGTYYVRVCMYTGSGCTNYSNQLTITLP